MLKHPAARFRALIATGVVVLLAGLPVGVAAATNRHHAGRHHDWEMGRIVGQLYVGGGPLSLARKHQKLREPARRFKVYLSKRELKPKATPRSMATIVAITRTNSQGRFAVRVRPGRYWIVGQWPFGTYCLPRHVTVRAHDVTHIRLGCSRK